MRDTLATTLVAVRPFVRVYLQDGIERRVPVESTGILNTDAIEALSKMAGYELDGLARIYGWVKVITIESERGWGSKVDDIFYFICKASARKWVADYNAGNNLSYVPDWYMRAELVEWR